ncbi:MAG: DinB family protein [Saprospiraceae bacterium]
MNNQKTLDRFLKTLNLWEKALTSYAEEDFQRSPSPDSWSLGQVYQHLIQATLNFHLPQIQECLRTNEHQAKRKNFKAFLAYHVLDGFPPIKIKVPASKEYTPLPPKNKQSIAEGLNKLKAAMQTALTSLDAPSAKGKTPHPAFAYLNAEEWYRLIDLHFRHHLRQKKSIETSLNLSS